MRNIKMIGLLFSGLLLLTIIPMVENVKADVTNTVTYYFNALGSGGFSNYPQYMYDGNNFTFAYTNAGASEGEALFGTNSPGIDYGNVTSVEMRIRGLYAGAGARHTIFFGLYGGTVYSYILTTLLTWSPYHDVTSQIYNGSFWTDIKNAKVSVYTELESCAVVIYCARVELRVTYIISTSVLNIPSSSVYPGNNSYTYPSVTLSWNCTAGGQYNYYLYKKIGAGSFWLDDSKTNQAPGTAMFYKRWFNASSLNTLYTWKVCMKNYTINNWKNFSFQFYINDSTVHLSDTKTNAAGTLTSLRNNTGFWITSIHNSSITPYNNAVNSSLTHVYYWVTNTWKDYCNSTSGILSYENIVNASGTHQKVWVPSLGKFKVWANYTGVTTPLTIHNNSVNVTGTNIKKLFSSGWHVYTNLTGNGSSCPSCNSTNLTLFENIVNASGTHQSYYDPLLGWYSWANYTGNSSAPGPGTGNYSIRLNFTGLQGYITWYGDYTGNTTNISFFATSNRSVNGSVHVDDDAYFLSGILSFDPAVMILSLFFGFFYIGYESKKRSGGFFMLFAGFLLIALSILVYGMLGYAAVLVVPFAIFIMLLGGKKAFYGPETEEPLGNKPTK